MLAAPWEIFSEHRRHLAEQLASRQRLQSFEYTERIRQAARAKQASHELNALAHETSRAMLVAALKCQLEARVQESKRPSNQRRCQ